MGVSRCHMEGEGLWVLSEISNTDMTLRRFGATSVVVKILFQNSSHMWLNHSIPLLAGLSWVHALP